MKLVLYGGVSSQNRELDELALQLTGKRNPRLVYVPYCSYESEIYFREFINDFSALGVNRFLYFPVDIPFDPILFREVMESDLIHLSGGNTFYFLKYLRRAKLFSPLRQFAKRGGVLTGLSAGGIIMTPSIATASFPAFDCDDNEEGVTNFKSLGLVNFEFFPHYKNSLRYERELKKYSKSIAWPLYATPDGSGIVVDGNKLTFVGKNISFFNGHKILLNKDGNGF